MLSRTRLARLEAKSTIRSRVSGELELFPAGVAALRHQQEILS